MTETSMDENMNIGLVGYGRLARHLAPVLLASGNKINQWCVRNHLFHNEIFLKYGVQPVLRVEEISDQSDIILLLVSDDAISKVALELNIHSAVVCHTSGMTSVDILPQKHSGVFYPLNTFDGKHVDWDRDTPLFIHSKDKKTLHVSRELAKCISDHVHSISPEDLQVVHLAAVISQNFSNHLIAQAEHILNSHELDRQLIHPLLSTMLRNLLESPARENQTGPAIRRDKNTIDKQLDLLKQDEHLKQIYEKLSDSIEKNLFK